MRLLNVGLMRLEMKHLVTFDFQMKSDIFLALASLLPNYHA
jgi:hypothetical protein